MSSEVSCSSVERCSPLVAVGSLVLPYWWLACVSTALHFACLHFSPTLHTGKRTKQKDRVTCIINTPTEDGPTRVSARFQYLQWLQSTADDVNEHLCLRHLSSFCTLSPTSVSLQHCKSPFSLTELMMCKKLLCLGLTQHPSFGPNWTKTKLARLSLNREVCITASAIPLPGTHPRSRAESPSSRWLSECLSYLSRWHCSNLMQESF